MMQEYKNKNEQTKLNPRNKNEQTIKPKNECVQQIHEEVFVSGDNPALNVIFACRRIKKYQWL